MEYRQYHNLTETYLNQVNEDTKQNLNEQIGLAGAAGAIIRGIIRGNKMKRAADKARKAAQIAGTAEAGETGLQMGNLAVRDFEAERTPYGKALDELGKVFSTYYNTLGAAGGEVFDAALSGVSDENLDALSKFLRFENEEGERLIEPGYNFLAKYIIDKEMYDQDGDGELGSIDLDGNGVIGDFDLNGDGRISPEEKDYEVDYEQKRYDEALADLIRSGREEMLPDFIINREIDNLPDDEDPTDIFRAIPGFGGN